MLRRAGRWRRGAEGRRFDPALTTTLGLAILSFGWWDE
jgi:hypothetical protein